MKAYNNGVIVTKPNWSKFIFCSNANSLQTKLNFTDVLFYRNALSDDDDKPLNLPGCKIPCKAIYRMITPGSLPLVLGW